MRCIEDARGVIREFYRESAFLAAGLGSLGPFLQMNVTETGRGAIRGLHGEDISKLVGIVHGEAFGAYVDTRPDSPSYAAVVALPLVAGLQVLVPAGVCNGFQTVSPHTQYLYSFDAEWVPGMAGTAVNPFDPALAIPWPLPIDHADPTMLSAKDAALPDLGSL